MSDIRVRHLEPEDWSDVERIYRDGIDTGNATFESAPPSWGAFGDSKHPTLRLVAQDESGIVGWAAASAISSRAVYAGVVEHSVYVAADSQGRGIGGMLLSALIADAEREGVWTIQSSVFPENRSSLDLHRRHGFREVGRRERIALMTYGPFAGIWRDTILIERRTAADHP